MKILYRLYTTASALCQCTSAPQKQGLNNAGLALLITERNGIVLEPVRTANCNESTCIFRNSPLDAGNKSTPLPGENTPFFITMERCYIFLYSSFVSLEGIVILESKCLQFERMVQNKKFHWFIKSK